MSVNFGDLLSKCFGNNKTAKSFYCTAQVSYKQCSNARISCLARPGSNLLIQVRFITHLVAKTHYKMLQILFRPSLIHLSSKCACIIS